MQNPKLKYHCGCGKAYTSYPAYTIHNKHKHNGTALPGTRLPKHYAPKRGRPSFPQPHRHPPHAPAHPARPYLPALTTTEVRLLQLEEKYGGVMREPEEEGEVDGREWKEMEKEASSQAGVKLVQSISKFNEVMATHLADSIALAVSEYLQLLTPYLLENLPAQEVRLNWEDASYEDTQIDAALLNRFLQTKPHLDRVNDLSRQMGKPRQLLLDVSVMLCEWLLRLRQCNSTLRLKPT